MTNHHHMNLRSQDGINNSEGDTENGNNPSNETPGQLPGQSSVAPSTNAPPPATENERVLGEEETPQSQRFTNAAGNHYASTPYHRSEMTFSQENVASLITSIQRTQTEAFKELLQSVMRTSPPVGHEGTLARCKSTFSGAQNESVEAFLDAVESYIDCANVSDSNVVKGLSMLLVGNASIWWQGLKDQIRGWNDAKENLISAYGDRRPPHRIYIDIFANPQGLENTDIFVSRIRALMSRLPQKDITEKAKLDMIYGLMHARIRKRIRREEFSSFPELLRLARNTEDSMSESERGTILRNERYPRAPHPSAPGVATPPPVAARPGSFALPLPRADRVVDTPQRAFERPPPPRAATLPAPRVSPGMTATPPPRAFDMPRAVATMPTVRAPPGQTAVPPLAAPSMMTDLTTTGATKKQRPLCSYCKKYGHTKDQCRKLMKRDPRTQNWFLMRTPWPGLGILGLYLFTVFKWLPQYVSKRPAYDLRIALAIYNAIQIIGCMYLVYQSLALGWLNHYSFICHPIDDGHHSTEYAWKVCYGYFAIKMIDLLDTVFFVLRKKQNQVTFLHVYHHFGMVALAWGIVKWVPGGHGTLLIPVNSFVHIIMYGYYLLSVWDESYKQSIWWKKHVTQLQILQFFVMLAHWCALVVARDCDFPKTPAFIIIPQDLFIVALFLDFYYRAYIRNPKKTS